MTAKSSMRGDAVLPTEAIGLSTDASPMPQCRRTQPDGTEVDIPDTDKEEVTALRRLDRSPSCRENEDLASAIQPEHRPKTPSDGRTEINDHGDTAQLNQESSKNEEQIPSPSQDDVSHIGSGLEDHRPVTTNPLLEVSDSGSEDEDELWDSIYDKLIEPPPEDGRKFLPLDDLRQIMVKPRVLRALKKLKGIDQGTRFTYANKVCDTTKYGSMQRTTRHKIFAILVHIEHINALPRVIEERIHDIHLPFTLETSPRWHLTYTITDDDTDTKRSVVFEGSRRWTKAKMNAFLEKQWLLMAPFFDMKAPKPLFYPLEAKVVLPFITQKEKLDDAYGGHSTVSRVMIHQAHHNCIYGPEAFFAIKKLHSCDQEVFEREHHAMKKFNKKDHKHLIKLLATYRHQDHWYFVFPWANGNLMEFWQRYPRPEPDRRLIMWIAEQSAGIASGLELIQHPPKDISLTDDARDFGRHGDLKPENILWFEGGESNENSISNGILKITDFGLTRYHHRSSRYVNAQDTKFSLTYKAPEAEVVEEVSQAYDIWTLGCLLLEFVTWYLKGHQGVDDFSKSRAHSDVQGDEIPLDTFYNIIWKGGVKTAVLKPAVIEWIQELHQDVNCSSYIHGMLTYIRHHLIRIDHKRRDKITDVVKRLRHMAEHCKNSPSYAADSCAKPPKKSDTMDSNRSDLTTSDYGCSKNCDNHTVHCDSIHLAQFTSGMNDCVPLHEIRSTAISKAASENHEMRDGTDENGVEHRDADMYNGFGHVLLNEDSMPDPNHTFGTLSEEPMLNYGWSGQAEILDPIGEETEEKSKRRSDELGDETGTPDSKRPKLAGNDSMSTLVGSVSEGSEKGLSHGFDEILISQATEA